uniref:transposase n=1 Tax=Candidatus Enterovibrio escicola TaxID=1927127 RepID=UPI0021E01AEC|nr:transposase [Candidatus Enterovibrio escacola]
MLRYQAFKGTVKRGKGTIGWFYGFKLHLIINDQGSIISVKVTTVNVDDRKVISEMVDELWGCLYGDKGYISGPLKRELSDKGVTLIMGIKNMKPKVMKLWDHLMLRK